MGGFHKSMSGLAAPFSKVWRAALVVIGFVLIFFTTSAKSPHFLHSYGPGVANADAPSSAGSSSSAGDSAASSGSGDSAGSSGDSAGSGDGGGDGGGDSGSGGK